MAGRRIVAWGLLAALLVGGVMVARNHPELRAMAQQWQTRNMFVASDTDQFDPGPDIGSHFPGVHALYQGHPINLLQPLAGPQGLVLAVLGSPAISPFCLRQLQQLNALQRQYEQAGIGLAAITHVSSLEAEALAEQYDITLPLLLDQQTLSFRTLGLLDTQTPTDSVQYGRAYPGFIVIDPKGIVVARLFLSNPHQRVDGKAALAVAQKALADRRH